MPRKEPIDVDTIPLKIPDPICQVVTGNRGIFQSINMRKKKMSLKDFHKKAISDRYNRTATYHIMFRSPRSLPSITWKKGTDVLNAKLLLRYRSPHFADYEDLERKYWKNVTFVNPIYGADVAGSLTDDDVDEWNINRLGSILDMVNDDYKVKTHKKIVVSLYSID